MVLTNRYTKNLIDKFPGFAGSKSLKENLSLFVSSDDDTINEHVIFTGLTRYVIDELIAKNSLITDEEIEIYNYLESMLVEFDNCKDENGEEFLFGNAICVCFLENLLNNACWEEIKYDRFIPYLGDKCKEFCKAWDQFTGVRSPGLWSAKEWEESPKGKDSVN